MKEDLEGEIWKDIVGFEGLYQVSNMGRVYSMPKEWVSANGGKRSHKGKILKQQQNKNKGGYLSVKLWFNKKGNLRTVHQLVAEAFLNHKPNGMSLVIDHKDDDPSNNNIDNLQIVTQRFNSRKTQGKYSSKYKGVVWHKQAKKWQAAIRINGKNKSLGCFYCELKAHLAYQKALKELA